MARPTNASSGRSWISSLLVALLWFAAIYMFAVGGCTLHYLQRTYFPAERVVAYTAKKPEVLDREFPAREPIGTPGEKPTGPTEITDRMLAAIVLHGSQVWFFKVSGPIEAVAKHAETFTSFLESVHFDGADSPPHWKLPEGWQQQPGNEMRFATLKIGSGKESLDLSVSSLPKGEGDDAEYLLANVNRWRGQLSLPPLAPRELSKEIKEMKLEGAQAYVVDFSGKLGSGGMGRGPFASGAGPFSGGPPSDGPSRPRDSVPGVGGGITFNAPAGWSQGKVEGMRKAAFRVEEGDQSAEITVIDLAAAANDLLTNVNRWRGQVKLDAISERDLPSLVREIDVGGVKGQYVELVGPADAKRRETILGVMAVAGEKVWFIKLQGDADLAAREKANFEAFVGSIQFSKR